MFLEEKYLYLILDNIRIIGTEERVQGANGCERLINPSFPDPIETTSDKDMICFQYNSIFVKK